jgi:ABC-2 type transport system ATP-binding protein
MLAHSNSSKCLDSLIDLHRNETLAVCTRQERVNVTASSARLAIQTHSISRVFGEHLAVDSLDLSVRQGELFSLLGPNGAGKTTTIKMLCCLVRHSSGTATIMGHDIQEDPLAVKQAIGFSPQDTAIAENLNARENLTLIGRIHGGRKDEVKRRSDELLEMTGLSDRATERVKRFSGGMKRRLSIAMALVSDPQVLFLDEPTLGLDPQARRMVWEYIAALKGEKTILLTTHYLEEADSLADRVSIIDEGKVVALGTPQELKDSISDTQVMVIKAKNITAAVVEGLRERYSDVVVVEDGVEIRAKDFDVYEIQDYLRPAGVVLESTHIKQTTLDDVFLHLTGRELRE